MPQTLTAADIGRLMTEAHRYRSRVTVRAVEVFDDAEWTTPHGDVLHASAGDWWVMDGGDRWSVSGDIFRSTYRSLTGDRYRKTSTVTAVAMSDTFAVQTIEGVATGLPGDWLVCNPSGEYWPVAAEVFERRYERV